MKSAKEISDKVQELLADSEWALKYDTDATHGRTSDADRDRGAIEVLKSLIEFIGDPNPTVIKREY